MATPTTPNSSRHACHNHGRGRDQGRSASERRLVATLAILLTFTATEALGGWFANSMALLAEAGHMLADCGSMLLAILAIRAARRPADSRHTFGSGRYQTLAAYTNGLMLLALTAGVMAEAARRLIAPPPVDGLLMLVIALLGGVANLAAYITLSGAASLNERGARAHVLSDLAGSTAAVAAALLILKWDFRLADPLLSILVSLLILRSGWLLVRESAHVLLQGTPPTLQPDEVALDLTRISGVRNVHHLHIWSLTGEEPVATLHAALETVANPQAVLQEIVCQLREHHDIRHATIQLESGPCLDNDASRCHRA